MSPSRHAWLLAASLAACGVNPLQWEKSGASSQTVQQDTDECRVQARFSAQPEPRSLSPQRSVDAKPLTSEEERTLVQTEHFQRCMREKGYSAKR